MSSNKIPSLTAMIVYAIEPLKTWLELVFDQGINPRSALVDMEIAAALWESYRKHRPYWQYILSFGASRTAPRIGERSSPAELLLFP